jgi:hypothetical protein
MLNSQLTKEVGYLTQQLRASLVDPGRVDRAVPGILAADLEVMAVTLDDWWANAQVVSELLNRSDSVPLITATLREKNAELESLRAALRKEKEDQQKNQLVLATVIDDLSLQVQHLTQQGSEPAPLHQEGNAEIVAELMMERERLRVENIAAAQKIEAERTRWSATEADLREQLRNVERQTRERAMRQHEADAPSYEETIACLRSKHEESVRLYEEVITGLTSRHEDVVDRHSAAAQPGKNTIAELRSEREHLIMENKAAVQRIAGLKSEHECAMRQHEASARLFEETIAGLKSEHECAMRQHEASVRSYESAIAGLKSEHECAMRQHEASARLSEETIAGLKSEQERMRVENEATGQRITALEAERTRWSAAELDLRKQLRDVERQSQERVQTMSRAVRDQMIAVTQQCEWRIARLKEIHAREVAALASRAHGR